MKFKTYSLNNDNGSSNDEKYWPQILAITIGKYFQVLQHLTENILSIEDLVYCHNW